jgi:hypothetical protein
LRSLNASFSWWSCLSYFTFNPPVINYHDSNHFLSFWYVC